MDNNVATKNPVMALHEYCLQKRRNRRPKYTFMSKCKYGGRFMFKVQVGNIITMGDARSKKLAKHEAAYKALIALAKHNPINLSETVYQVKPIGDFVSPLFELCDDQKIGPPKFKLLTVTGPPHRREFTYECALSCFKTKGSSYSVKQAKHQAARSMLILLDSMPEQDSDEPISVRPLEDSATSPGELTDDEASPEQEQTRGAEYEGSGQNHNNGNDYLPFVLFIKIVKNNVKFETFLKLMETKNEVALHSLMRELNLRYIWAQLNKQPPTVQLFVDMHVPLIMCRTGTTLREAKQDAINFLFSIISNSTSNWSS